MTFDESNAPKTFSEFCGRRESDGLFSQQFSNAWVHDRSMNDMDIPFNDQFSVFIAGGEL